ncbi:NAD(P)/FAD-dependent oxidoreductase, partial [candidate division CSSED10-310 bacterium]
SITTHQTALRKFNSPAVKKYFEIRRQTPSLIFKWEHYIDRLWEIGSQQGVEFSFNTEVKAPLLKDNICLGLRLENGTEIFGRTTLACDGHSSPLGKAAGIDYRAMNCPIVKSLRSEFKAEYSGFEFFFIAQGQLPDAPQFPPAVVFVFPRGSGLCEVGLMVFRSTAAKLKRFWIMPDEKEIHRVWLKLIETYPRFSELMRHTTVEFEHVTSIPCAKMHKTAMIRPGLICIGDSVGFVEASGASGILAAMKSARFVATFLSQNARSAWTTQSQAQFNIAFQESSIYKRINKLYRMVLPVLNFVFAGLRTPEKINNYWFLVKLFYKLV